MTTEAAWWKYPGEEQLFRADWSDLLDGDPISGPVTVTVDGLTAVVSSTTNNVSTIRVTGGVKGTNPKLVFTINTVGGQIFTPVKHIEIRPLK